MYGKARTNHIREAKFSHSIRSFLIAAMPSAFQILRKFSSPESARFTNTFSDLLRVLQDMAEDVATQSLAIAECNQNVSKRVWEKLRTRVKLTLRCYPEEVFAR